MSPRGLAVMVVTQALVHNPVVFETMCHMCDVEAVRRCAANGDVIMNPSLQTGEAISNNSKATFSMFAITHTMISFFYCLISFCTFA